MSRSRLGGVLEASWRSLRGQHSSKLVSQIEGKSIKSQCKNRSKNRCLLSSGFDAILIDFRRENGGMLAPKIDTNCEKYFFDKSCSRCSGGLILEVPRVEVGTKNQSNIVQRALNWTDSRDATLRGGATATRSGPGIPIRWGEGWKEALKRTHGLDNARRDKKITRKSADFVLEYCLK